MQLGARWQAGDPPHPGVPTALHAAIADAEAALTESARAGASWTLTWLERRPRAELIAAGGATIADVRLESDGGAARPGDDEDDDDWLA